MSLRLQSPDRNRLGVWFCGNIYGDNTSSAIAVVNKRGELYIRGIKFDSVNKTYSSRYNQWYKYTTESKVVDFRFSGAESITAEYKTPTEDEINRENAFTNAGFMYITDTGKLIGIDTKTQEYDSSSNHPNRSIAANALSVYSNFQEKEIATDVLKFVKNTNPFHSYPYIKSDGKTYISHTYCSMKAGGSVTHVTYIGPVQNGYCSPNTKNTVIFHMHDKKIYDGILTKYSVNTNDTTVYPQFPTNDGFVAGLTTENKIISLGKDLYSGSSSSDYTIHPKTNRASGSDKISKLYDPVYMYNDDNHDIVDFCFFSSPDGSDLFGGFILRSNGDFGRVGINESGIKDQDIGFVKMLSNVKQFENYYMYGMVCLLENGDVYYLNTNSKTEDYFTFKKVNTLSNIEYIIPNGDKYSNNFLCLTKDDNIVDFGGVSYV